MIPRNPDKFTPEQEEQKKYDPKKTVLLEDNWVFWDIPGLNDNEYDHQYIIEAIEESVYQEIFIA